MNVHFDAQSTNVFLIPLLGCVGNLSRDFLKQAGFGENRPSIKEEQEKTGRALKKNKRKPAEH